MPFYFDNPGAYAGGSAEDDYSGYNQMADPAQIPPPPGPSNPTPNYLGLPWRRPQIPGMPQLAGNPLVSDGPQGLTGQGPLQDQGPSPETAPPPPAALASNVPVMTGSPGTAGPHLVQRPPAQAQLQPSQQQQLPQPPTAAQIVPGRPNPLLTQVQSLYGQELPQAPPPMPKIPGGFRGALGTLLANKHPGLAQLVEYGPGGIAQGKRYAQYQQTVAGAERAGIAGSQDQSRVAQDLETQRLRNEQEYQHRAQEAQKKSDAFDKQINSVTINLHGQEIDPTDPLPPNHTKRVLKNPITGETRAFAIPAPDEYVRQQYLAKTEPTPQFIKDKWPATPDRLPATIIEQYTKAIQSGQEGEANRLLHASINATNNELKANLAKQTDETRRDLAAQANQLRLEIATMNNQTRRDLAEANKQKLPSNLQSRVDMADTTADQAMRAIQLIDEVVANHKDLTGPLNASRWIKTKLGTEPEDIGAVDGALESIAALQPGQHNFRSAAALAEFKRAMGIDPKTGKPDGSRAWLVNPGKAKQSIQEIVQFNQRMKDNILKNAGITSGPMVTGAADLGNPNPGPGAPAGPGTPPRPAQIPTNAKAQYSPTRKQWRYSTDGGTTWQTLNAQ